MSCLFVHRKDIAYKLPLNKFTDMWYKIFLRNGSIDWIGVYLVTFSDYSEKQNKTNPKTFVWIYNPESLLYLSGTICCISYFKTLHPLNCPIIQVRLNKMLS